MARELSKIINNWVPEESKVIDFGCGDGSLLEKLIQTKNVLGYGVEINDSKIDYIIKNYPVSKSYIFYIPNLILLNCLCVEIKKIN